MKNEIFINILLLIFVFCILYSIVEIGYRSFGIESYGYPKGLRIPDEDTGYRYQPGFSGYFPGKLYKDIEIKINSKGLRDLDHNYSNNNNTRILGLGDSVTFGSGVEYDNTYLRQLEIRFQESNKKVEIIKAGINGYQFDQQLIYYYNEGFKYDPDIIIVGIVLNDAQISVPQVIIQEKFCEMRETFFEKVRCNACRTLKFACYARARITDLLITKGEDYDKVYFDKIYALWENETWERYKKNLVNFNKKLKSEDKELYLVIFPYTFQFNNSENEGEIPQKKISQLAAENEIPVLDMLPYLDKEDYEKYYLLGDTVHLNAEGYQLASDLLYDFIVNRSDLI